MLNQKAIKKLYERLQKYNHRRSCTIEGVHLKGSFDRFRGSEITGALKILDLIIRLQPSRTKLKISD